ncbi:holo-ACP synthase [Vibrio sp. SS-MA-C1-2]|uniref:holo-ACP synthase n=1 Tax=Vibrio sp. SS-MA-C1-2 TaxID=2908646 RepID=UPI001F21911A|nr:holo-ACP synthase [Vibrio sp. SS-MA-C1-2]UJF19028.1 holo-ACP synthase [Vibrio sp. SS-MA-C1-2]
MALIGLGTDIVEISRIEKVLRRQKDDSFAERILHPNERARFKETHFPARYLAKRFAVKEAASKALGTGIACGVTFQDFQVNHDELGKPLLILSDKALELFQQRQGKHCHLTIADEKQYAVATVILES